MTGPIPPVDPSAGPMLTCTLCGVSSRASRWSRRSERSMRAGIVIGTILDAGCPACDREVCEIVVDPHDPAGLQR